MVTVRLRSHCRSVTGLPPGPGLTSLVRAPLMAVSDVEPTFPPTEMFFLMCRSCAWVAVASANRVRIEKSGRKPRERISSSLLSLWKRGAVQSEGRSPASSPQLPPARVRLLLLYGYAKNGSASPQGRRLSFDLCSFRERKLLVEVCPDHARMERRCANLVPSPSSFQWIDSETSRGYASKPTRHPPGARGRTFGTRRLRTDHRTP